MARIQPMTYSSDEEEPYDSFDDEPDEEYENNPVVGGTGSHTGDALPNGPKALPPVPVRGSSLPENPPLPARDRRPPPAAHQPAAPQPPPLDVNEIYEEPGNENYEDPAELSEQDYEDPGDAVPLPPRHNVVVEENSTNIIDTSEEIYEDVPDEECEVADTPLPPKEKALPEPPRVGIALPARDREVPATPRERDAPLPPRDREVPAPPRERDAPAPPREALLPPRDREVPAPPREREVHRPAREREIPEPPQSDHDVGPSKTERRPNKPALDMDTVRLKNMRQNLKPAKKTFVESKPVPSSSADLSNPFQDAKMGLKKRSPVPVNKSVENESSALIENVKLKPTKTKAAVTINSDSSTVPSNQPPVLPSERRRNATRPLPPPPVESEPELPKRQETKCTHVTEKDHHDISLTKRPEPKFTPVVDQVHNDPNRLDFPWFFDSCDRKIAINKVNNSATDGSFLVRRSASSPKSPYTLVVLYNGHVNNLQIRLRPDEKFALGKEKIDETVFDTVPDMIKFYQNNFIELAGDNKSGAGRIKLRKIAV